MFLIHNLPYHPTRRHFRHLRHLHPSSLHFPSLRSAGITAISPPSHPPTLCYAGIRSYSTYPKGRKRSRRASNRLRKARISSLLGCTQGVAHANVPEVPEHYNNNNNNNNSKHQQNGKAPVQNSKSIRDRLRSLPTRYVDFDLPKAEVVAAIGDRVQ